jgi:hypothetical protein
MLMWKPAGCLLLFTFCLSASTIIVSVPKGTGSLQIGGSIDQYLYSDFVIPSDTTYSNVFIDAWITGADPVTAYLTTSVGAGAKTLLRLSRSRPWTRSTTVLRSRQFSLT